MPDTLQQDIKDAIERSLPAQVAGALQARLKQADRDATELAAAAKLIDAREATIAFKDTVIRDLTAKSAAMELQLTTLRGRERDFGESERKVLVADLRAEKADAVANAILSTVQAFTKVPEVRRSHTVSSFEGGTTQYNNGVQSFVPNGQKSTTETDVESTS